MQKLQIDKCTSFAEVQELVALTNAIFVELWLGVEKELSGETRNCSKLCSTLREPLRAGVTIREFLIILAERYPVIAEQVFDVKEERLSPHAMLVCNGEVISSHAFQEIVLKDGDRVKIFPVLAGG